MRKIPKNFHFDGAKFGKHFFSDFDPNVPDPRFWFDTQGNLFCPSVDLETVDLTLFEAEIKPPFNIQEELEKIKTSVKALEKK